jgi:hypothetical protein
MAAGPGGTRSGRHHLHRPRLLGSGTEWTVDRDGYLQHADQLFPNHHPWFRHHCHEFRTREVIPGTNVYDNATQAGTGTTSNTVSWLFPTAVTAFGADFFGAGAGRLSLNGDFDGTGMQSLIVNTTIGGSDGFPGVIGTSPFTSIILGNPLTQVDSFSIDNASFAPVPSPLPLLSASLAYGWSRRLRQRMGVHSRQMSWSAAILNSQAHGYSGVVA